MNLNQNKIKIWTNSNLSSDLFSYFYKDLKTWKKTTKKTLIEDPVYPILKECEDIPKEKIPIFKLDPLLLDDIDLKNFNLKKVVFPFEYLFIETPIYIEHQENSFTISGFLVKRLSESVIFGIKNVDTLRYYYVRDTSFKNKINFCFGEHLNWRSYQGYDKTSYLPDASDLNKKIGDQIQKRIFGLLYLISKKQYYSYKKYTLQGYIQKEIVNSRKVMSHKRHFWKDSGRFKIPYMSKEELKEKGYEIDEIVLRDEEIRENVPYRIISESSIENNKNKNIMKKREFLYKRQLRKENKLFEILQQLFPKEYIKRHDRRRLKGLELDFYIHSLRLAFEYDGEQHFHRQVCEKAFKSDFDALKKRDRRKNKLCRRLGIKLVRIKYDMPLNKSFVKKLLN